jgi:hypothetical protein
MIRIKAVVFLEIQTGIHVNSGARIAQSVY